MDPDWEHRQDMLEHRLVLRDGHIDVPTLPGLGTSIDPSVVARWPSVRNIGIATGGSNTGTDAENLLFQARRPRASLFPKDPHDD